GRYVMASAAAVDAELLRRQLLTGLALELVAVGPQLPEGRALDAELARIELRIQTLLLLLAVVLQRLQRRTLQEEDADDVQPGHRAHADVAEAPGGARGGDGAVRDGDEDQALQDAEQGASQGPVLHQIGRAHV